MNSHKHLFTIPVRRYYTNLNNLSYSIEDLGSFYANNDEKHQIVDDDDRYIANLISLYGDTDESARNNQRQNQQQQYYQPQQQQYYQPQQPQQQQSQEKNTKTEVRILK